MFRGRVQQIRLNASMTSNVVVYTVVIAVDNSDLKLLPYLTANIQFEVESRTDALLVPNGALRFKPQADQVIDGKIETDSNASANARTVWLIDEESGLLRPVHVQTGLSDGTNTEVLSGDLAVDSNVVLREVKEVAEGEVNNPFAPPRFRGTKTAKDKKD